MKRYLLVSLAVLGGAVLLAVVAFVLVQLYFISASSRDGGEVAVSDRATTTISTTPTPEVSVPSVTGEPVGEVPISSVSGSAAPTNEKPIREPFPLSSIPLSDAQKQLLSGAGIDYDTFIITQAMIDCAATSVGEERLAELSAGSAPSFLEGVALLRCLE